MEMNKKAACHVLEAFICCFSAVKIADVLLFLSLSAWFQCAETSMDSSLT